MMSQTSRRERLAAVRPRYTLGDRSTKQRVLDELVASTGCHRKYAIQVLNHSPPRRAHQLSIHTVSLAALRTSLGWRRRVGIEFEQGQAAGVRCSQRAAARGSQSCFSQPSCGRTNPAQPYGFPVKVAVTNATVLTDSAQVYS
jgi:hypothetical protein